MKVKVIARAYYNDSIVNIGDIIDFEGKNMPSWATLLDGIESDKGRKNKKEEVKKNPETPIERVEYLNELISEGIEKNILIENSDKKTVEEQIKELEEALMKENK